MKPLNSLSNLSIWQVRPTLGAAYSWPRLNRANGRHLLDNFGGASQSAGDLLDVSRILKHAQTSPLSGQPSRQRARARQRLAPVRSDSSPSPLLGPASCASGGRSSLFLSSLNWRLMSSFCKRARASQSQPAGWSGHLLPGRRLSQRPPAAPTPAMSLNFSRAQ